MLIIHHLHASVKVMPWTCRPHSKATRLAWRHSSRQTTMLLATKWRLITTKVVNATIAAIKLLLGHGSGGSWVVEEESPAVIGCCS